MQWPPNYTLEFKRRAKLIYHLRSNPLHVHAANSFYETNCKRFINDWGVTYDPRNIGHPTLPTILPFITFPRQDDMIDFLLECIDKQADGLEEKSRDMGATWIAVWVSIWLWKYKTGAAIGWGSRKQELVDRLGDPGSIFEKIRMGLRYLPKQLHPEGFNAKDHMSYMKIINPQNGSSITGEVGDNIGRGGRTSIYFKDESAHYEHPELVEAALGDNTNVQIDISSVHGLGTVFQRKREAGIEWSRGQSVVKGKTNVFVADWSDHPAKTKEWYEQRKAKATSEGLLHIFAQEVDRDYAASVIGVVIPAEYVSAAIDAHIKLDYLGDWGAGMYGAALDVADGGMDRNALAIRKGPVVRSVAEWGERDTGVTTRNVVANLRDLTPIELQYDCIGVGSGVKAEFNRLKDEDLLPDGIQLVAWNAGAEVLYKERLVIPKDPDQEEDEYNTSIKNKDFYANLKAQGWWMLRQRFEKTYRAIMEGEAFEVDELISLPSDLPLLRSLQKELSQPTAGPGARLKMTINKMPEGTKSPNLGDAVMMAFWPIPQINMGRASFGVYSIGGRT